MSIYGNPVMLGGSGGGGGGIPSGPSQPTGGSDGDLYVQTFPVATGVTYVEYLESSGTQYIDTGIIANQGTDVVCDCTYRGNDFIIGNRTGGATNASKALIVVGSGSGICAYKSNEQGTVANYVASASAGDRCKSIIKTAKFQSAQTSLLVPREDASALYSKTLTSFTADYSQALFGLKQGSSVSVASRATLHRVTYLQDGVPIHDYLPCLDTNGVPCMWDNIAKEYVYNDGTGNFTYGSSVTPDELEPVLYQKVNGAWEVVAWA